MRVSKVGDIIGAEASTAEALPAVAAFQLKLAVAS